MTNQTVQTKEKPIIEQDNKDRTDEKDKDKTLIETLIPAIKILIFSILFGSIIPIFITYNDEIPIKHNKVFLTEDLKCTFCLLVEEGKIHLTQEQSKWETENCLPFCSINGSCIKDDATESKKIHFRPAVSSPYLWYVWLMGYFSLSSLLWLLPRWSPNKFAEPVDLGDGNKSLGNIPKIYGGLNWLAKLFGTRVVSGAGKTKSTSSAHHTKINNHGIIKYLGYCLILWFICRLINLYRNASYYFHNSGLDDRRVLFAFTNSDFCMPCFVMLEINWIIFLFILVMIWFQWSDYLKSHINYLKKQHDKAKILEYALDHVNMDCLSKLFLEWQVASIMLAVAFIPFTMYYYGLFKLDDQRYFLDVLIIHSLWAFTWLIISLPLGFTVYKWRLRRSHAISILSIYITQGFYDKDKIDKDHQEIIQSTVESYLKLMTDVQPINFWNIMTSSIIAAIAFLSPVIKDIWMK